MKIDLTLDELCLVIATLARRTHEDGKEAREQIARINTVSYDALALAQHGAKCADLADRLHNELEAAEHAENLLDNME